MKLQKLSRERFVLVTGNNTPLGEIYREVDGYYVFWPYTVTGFYSEWFMRDVADKLHELNKEWDKTVEKELSKKCTRKPRSKRK